MDNYEAIVIGASAGGMEAFSLILPQLSKGFSMPIMIAQHLHENDSDYMANYLNEKSRISVQYAWDKGSMNPGSVYFSPAKYHLLVEDKKTLSLSSEGRINWSRPCTDVLFQSAAEVFESKLIGIILTGGNRDGSKGLKKIKEYGGLTVVQNPSTAHADCIPTSAIQEVSVDHILTLQGIADLLNQINNS